MTGLRVAYKPLVRWATRKILKGRSKSQVIPEAGRWSSTEVDSYLEKVWIRVNQLVQIANLDDLPTRGSQHNVFLAAITTAAYQELLSHRVEDDDAKQLVADIGWQVYALMLRIVAGIVGLTTDQPSVRLERSLRMLMVFPFSAPGAPAYEVEFRADEDRVFTHWTHCPPQTFVRQVIEKNGDKGELEAFYQSWCLYDWPGADLLVADGKSNHYERSKTLSRGDRVCDMCWYAKPQGKREKR